MARATAFRNLRELLRRFHEVLNALVLVAQTTPNKSHCLADQVADAAREAAGWVREARKAAATAARESSRSGAASAARVRHALATCQNRLRSARRRLRGGVSSRQSQRNLLDLARRKPGHWGGWVEAVQKSIPPVRKGAAAAEQAISHCWQELAEQGGPEIVIRNVAIGQQFSPIPDLKPRSR